VSVEPNIKNRVTGAIVLVALGVIFLPLILDGQKKNQILESQIPEKPIKGEIILVNVDDIQSNSKANSNNSADKSDKTNGPEVNNKNSAKEIVQNKEPIQTPTKTPKNESKTEQSATKKEVSKPKPEIKHSKPEVIVSKPVEERRSRPNYKAAAYVIQLGSFGNKTNANKLVSKLKKASYKAYLSNGKSNGKTIYRVLVGPILIRNQAESKINGITKLTGLKPIIVTYDPLKH